MAATIEALPSLKRGRAAMKMLPRPRETAGVKENLFKNLALFFAAPFVGGISLFAFQIVGAAVALGMSAFGVWLKIRRF